VTIIGGLIQEIGEQQPPRTETEELASRWFWSFGSDKKAAARIIQAAKLLNSGESGSAEDAYGRAKGGFAKTGGFSAASVMFLTMCTGTAALLVAAGVGLVGMAVASFIAVALVGVTFGGVAVALAGMGGTRCKPYMGTPSSKKWGDVDQSAETQQMKVEPPPPEDGGFLAS